MSSSEQAPEPTMDEILASIRKIISDDEPGEAPQPEAVAPEQAEVPAAQPAPAGDGLADDLAKALNDTQAGAEDVDDILDLTKIVEEQPQAVEPQVESPLGVQAGPAEAVAAPVPVAEPGPEPQAAPAEAVGDVDIASLLAEAGVEDTVIEAPAEPQAPAGEDLSAMLGQGEEAAAPVAENAPISEALSAMTPSAGEPVAEAAGDVSMPDAAMPESEPVAEYPAPVETSLNTGDFTAEASEVAVAPEVAEAAAEPMLQEAPGDASFEVPGEITAEAAPVAEPEVPVEEPALETPVQDVVAISAAPEEVAPVEASAPVEEPAPEVAATETASTDSGGKSLEDSVKDLLRPMLREWMDDNLERIVQDEVTSGNIKGQDS